MTAETQKANSDRRYAVFLSYRHADNKEQGRQWAIWLHQVLEGYEIPADLIGTRNGNGDLIPPSLYPVFRDEEELPADADLTRNIRRALENSDLLVVLCSPRAVESRFVADEIRYFKELGKADRILALMLDGEPNASDDPGKAKLGIKPEAECLPEPLRYGVAGDGGTIDWSQRTEPIAADVRPAGMPEQGWTTGAAYREALSKNGKPNETEIAQKVREYEERLELAKLKVVAGALGVPLGVLSQRDKAMQLQKAKQRARTMRRWLAAVGLLAVLALVGGVYAWFQRVEAVRQRDLVAERETAARNTASETDFAIADLKLQTGEVPTGLAHLSRSLRNNPRNLKASSRILSLPRHLSFPISKLSHKDIVRTATFSPEGKRIVTTAEDNTAQVWDGESGKAVGEPMRHRVHVDSPIFSPDGRLIVTVPEEKIAQVHDAQSGKALGEPMRHDEMVFSASFSPDGKWIVTGSADKKAQVWDAQSGKAVGEPMLHEGLVFLTTFSPDGKRIVTLSGEQIARIWDAQTGRAVGERMYHPYRVTGASFSPDGKWIVTASHDNNARIWDAQSGKAVGEPMHHEGFLNAASFSPDGTLIVTAAVSAALIWDAHSGKALRQLTLHDVNSASFSPDGKWIVTASKDKTARVWDAQSGTAVGAPLRHETVVLSASFSPDGKRLVTTSHGKTALVWDFQSSGAIGAPLRHEANVRSASFSPDGKRIVTASGDGTARMWDAQSTKAVSEPMHHESLIAPLSVSRDGGKTFTTASHRNVVYAATFSSDGKRIVTASEEKTSGIWDAQTAQAVGEPMHRINGASFSPDGKWIVTASEEGAAQIWDAQDGKAVGGPIRPQYMVMSASFSPDGKRIVTASIDGTAQVWDAQSAKAIGKPMHHQDGVGVRAASFSPDGKWIVTVSVSTARVWDAQSGESVGEPLWHGATVDTASFSPDSKWIVTASKDNAARVWDAQSGKLLGEPMRHEGDVNTATFSPDGKCIVTASHDGTARVWDAQSGKAVGEPMRHQSFVWAASFSADGKWIVTASEDKTARVWDAGLTRSEAPDWLMGVAETLGGLHFDSKEVLEPSKTNPRHLREELRGLTGADELSQFGRWFVGDPATRTISPLSSITVPEFVSQRLMENTSDSVEEAYLVDAGNPLVLASLTKFEQDKARALFLGRHAIKRARMEGGEARVEQVRAIVRSAIPDFTE